MIATRKELTRTEPGRGLEEVLRPVVVDPREELPEVDEREEVVRDRHPRLVLRLLRLDPDLAAPSAAPGASAGPGASSGGIAPTEAVWGGRHPPSLQLSILCREQYR